MKREMEKKETRGGARPGSGRASLPDEYKRHSVLISLPYDLYLEVAAMGKFEKSRYLERLISNDLAKKAAEEK